MVEFLPFYFFLFVTFPTFQCRYVYQYLIFFFIFNYPINKSIHPVDRTILDWQGHPLGPVRKIN